MKVFFEPNDGVAADFIPFYWQGEYHLFYLKDYRDHEGRGEGTPWFHLGTRDFITFTDYGEALPRGTVDEQDLYVFTGCVMEHNGLFHIYYTGHNPHFRVVGRPEQAVMHATSPDLITWTKDPANPILFANEERYEPHDWRDPFVLWNEDEEEFWMLLAAREKVGPGNRRGCIALVTSKDLVDWEIQEPFWSPGLYFTHECPDLFRIGDYWYLVYSTFSERTVTHYRTSQTLSGPWLASADDVFDTRAYYAAKTAGDGNRHFSFGWNPTRRGNVDDGKWQWGGTLVVHELNQISDGSLSVSVPPELTRQYTKAIELAADFRLGNWSSDANGVRVEVPDSFAWCLLGSEATECCLDVTIDVDAGTRAAGVLLRADDTLDHYFQIRLEPGSRRVVFDRWPRPGDEPFIFERPLDYRTGKPVKLQIFRQGTVVIVYIDGQVALSTRAYEGAGENWGLFVSEGAARFTGLFMTVT